MNYSLDGLIEFNINKPMRDSYLVDCKTMDLNSVVESVYGIINRQNYLMIQTGITEFERAIIARHQIIDKLDNLIGFDWLQTKKVRDSYILDNEIFIIIKSVDGKPIIHPPFIETNDPHKATEIMSWDEYFYKLAIGEHVSLMNVCPYLQAKLINVQI